MSKVPGAECKVIRTTSESQGTQGFDYMEAISAESVESKGICMHLLTIPPSGRSKAHLHQDHETAIYVLSGKAGMWHGEQLEQHIEVEAGQFLYIPPGVPHLTYNASATESCSAVIARTDPNQLESVTLLPELEGLRPDRSQTN
ncbi:putative RmlC-like cupin family protein [Paenibacillus taihuensis]|uniref:Putative RmlC-like cupin family protein n=1 Tax=Paenibacillus taihuensis TaxID=1156355 RepID=A0A3D9S2M0_9BACL|nr:cupin domain-containing protein [Paenibacillus taihuensis]REE86112.1 putative RmlC-like cupin family protein [Paenibacillus taihuensis]